VNFFARMVCLKVIIQQSNFIPVLLPCCNSWRKKLEERLKRVFCESLKVDPKVFDEDLAVGDLPEWDSLGHAMLLQSVEAEFKITLDVTDAIDIETIGDLMSTVEKYVGSGNPNGFE